MTKMPKGTWPVLLFLASNLVLQGCVSAGREYYWSRLKPDDAAFKSVHYSVEVEVVEVNGEVDLTRTLIPPVRMTARVVKSDLPRIQVGSLIRARAIPLSFAERETLGFDKAGHYLGVLPK